MKLLLENWNNYLLNEISFKIAKKRLESKALPNWIKSIAWDEETKTATLNREQVNSLAGMLGRVLTSLIPQDLKDGQKGTSLEWLISVAINDPEYKNKFYDFIPTFRRGAWSDNRWLETLEWDLETYWHAHDYTEKKDIFSIASIRELHNITKEAERRYQKAQEEKIYLDAEEGTEILRNDEEWKIAAIHNKGAACSLGKGTNWCTAAPGLDYFSNYYEEDDPLFYFENVQEKGRWQFHYGSGQFMDPTDTPVADKTRDHMTNLLLATTAGKKYPIIKKAKRNWVAQNWSAPAEDLAAIAMARDLKVNTLLIKNPNTPTATLSFLYDFFSEALDSYIKKMTSDELPPEDGPESPYELIIYGITHIAAHTRLPPEKLDQLAHLDKETLQSALVKPHVAANLNTSAKTLQKLSELGESTLVRQRVVENPSTAPETLAKMVQSTLKRVQSLSTSLELSRGKALRQLSPILIGLARNRNTPPESLTSLTGFRNANLNIRTDLVCIGVARNPNAPPEALSELAKSGWYGALIAIAGHPNTPLKVLDDLTSNKSPYVAEKAHTTRQSRGRAKQRSLAETKNKKRKIIVRIKRKNTQMTDEGMSVKK
jgi:hypothetical protein